MNQLGSLSEQARLARRKAPQCIGGRWLSVSESESYVLAFDHDDFQAMLADAFFSTPDDASQLVAATTCPHDELKLDAIKAHKEKITKYRRDVKAAATHMLFFATLKLSHAAKGPFDHLLCFLQSRLVDPTTTSHLSLLVSGKASEIAQEFETAMLDDTWADVARTMGTVDNKFWTGLVSAFCCGAAQYNFRILDLLTEWPWLWMLFADSPPEVACDTRQRLSSDLLRFDLSKLDVTTAKICTIFKSELSACAQSGTLDSGLHSIILQWRVKARCDIQLIESANSVITRMTGLSKCLEQPLMSTRFTIKKELAEHGVARRGCVAAQGAIAAVHNVVQSHVGSPAFKALMDCPTRFLDLGQEKQPMPLHGPPLAERIAGAPRIAQRPLWDEASCPWRSCGLLAPDRISHSVLQRSLPASLRWARAWSAGVADVCFWLLDPGIVPGYQCMPGAGATAF